LIFIFFIKNKMSDNSCEKLFKKIGFVYPLIEGIDHEKQCKKLLEKIDQNKLDKVRVEIFIQIPQSSSTEGGGMGGDKSYHPGGMGGDKSYHPGGMGE
jgi:hypothetical protein